MGRDLVREVRERGRSSLGETAQLKGGYCLHIKTLPPTPRKSSNLPWRVLQFNFSIVLGDNPLIIGKEVALSPGQRPSSHREPRRVPLPPSGLLLPSLLGPFCLFISTHGVSGRLPISATLQVVLPFCEARPAPLVATHTCPYLMAKEGLGASASCQNSLEPLLCIWRFNVKIKH